MVFVLELGFTDDPARLAARPAHRELLITLHASGELLAAGPWDDDSGAMLVFRADRARMERIIADDPYYSTPGVTVTSLREWRPIVSSWHWASPRDLT